MTFEKIAGVTGKIYRPRPLEPTLGKHRCPDCFSCQWCSAVRCSLCRGGNDRPAPAKPPADPCRRRG